MSKQPRRILTSLAALLVAPHLAFAHYIWVTIEPGEGPNGATGIHAFFNEPPVADAGFTKYVRDITLAVDGQSLPSTVTEESRDATWVGKPPVMVDTERDLGVMTKGETTFRLSYTARAQTEPVSADSKEEREKLRVRLIKTEGAPRIEVLFNGKAVPKARLRVYPDQGEPSETTADDQGQAEIAGLSNGTAAVWANWVDRSPGELDGKPYNETRYYATFTYNPVGAGAEGSASAAGKAVPTTFATMPDPAVNSFGGAVLGKWLYVYSGHIGRTHRYSVETTAKHFRRLNLEDRATWEDLPMGEDLQGVALVSDGRYLYRIGGMVARNPEGTAHDLHSVASFARFDPETKTWTDLAPMPEARSTHDAVVIGRTIYAVGGWNMMGNADGSVFLETSVAYDLDKPEAGWREVPQPFERRALSVGEQSGKLYVLGGLVGGGMKVDRRVDVYDPKTGTWSRGPELPAGGRTEGFGTSAFQVGGRLYYSGASGRIYRLSATGAAWEPIGAWYLPRITHRLLPGPGDTLLAVGGNAKGQQAPTIEAVTLPKGPSAPIAAAAAGD